MLPSGRRFLWTLQACTDTSQDYLACCIVTTGHTSLCSDVRAQPPSWYHPSLDGYRLALWPCPWNAGTVLAKESPSSLAIFLLRTRRRVCHPRHVCDRWRCVCTRGSYSHDWYDRPPGCSTGQLLMCAVSIVVITFELTGALTYVLPIMIAVMISKWVGDAFGKRGIYESWIRFKEYPFLENRDDPVPDIPVVEIMTRIEDLIVITQTGHTIDSLEETLRVHPYKGFPVVSDTRGAALVGYIARSELRFALHQARQVKQLPGHIDCVFANVPPSFSTFVDMRPYMDHTPITLQQSCSLTLTATLFQKLGLRYILFAKHGELQGLLTKKDVYFVLNSEERLNLERQEGAETRRLLDQSHNSDLASEYSLESPGEDRNLLGSL